MMWFRFVAPTEGQETVSSMSKSWSRKSNNHANIHHWVITLYLFTAAAALAGKKGACLVTVREYKDDWEKRVASLNVDWHYSWGPTRPESQLVVAEFVPMIWGWNRKDETRNDRRLADIMRRKKAGEVSHLLGFNEPCSKSQSNLPVDVAIAAWPKLMATGLRLGSPAPVHAEKEWMQDFMKKAAVQGHPARENIDIKGWYFSEQ